MTFIDHVPADVAIELSQLIRVSRAAAAFDQPNQLLEAVADVIKQTVGYKMLTISEYLQASCELERIYSTDTQSYPVGGRKLKRGTNWARCVLDRGEVFFSRNREDIREAFDDHERIFQLGISSIINVPICWRGATMGTLNLSGIEGNYSSTDIAKAYAFRTFLVPALIFRTASRAS